MALLPQTSTAMAGFPAKKPGGLMPSYKAADENVASNIAKVIAADGPIMAQARTEGLKQVNRRGLLSSTMAIGAAQNEVLKKATDIGTSQATINATRNLSNQEFNQNLTRDKVGYDAQRGLKQMDVDLQERLKTWDLDAVDRANTGTFITNLTNTFENARKDIMANENLSPEQRTKELKGLENRRDRYLDLFGSTYDVDIAWGNTGATGTGGTKTDTKTGTKTTNTGGSKGGGSGGKKSSGKKGPMGSRYMGADGRWYVWNADRGVYEKR